MKINQCSSVHNKTTYAHTALCGNGGSTKGGGYCPFLFFFGVDYVQHSDRPSIAAQCARALPLRHTDFTHIYAGITGKTTGITRNSSGDEIANVNFLCDDIVHALKIQQTLA